MTRTLADMTPEERQNCVGMWCEYKDGNGTKLAVIVETWLTDPEACMVYDISCHEDRHPLGGDVTPRLDLPRAWTPSGEPVPGECEYAVGHVVEYADGQKDCRPRYREDSRQSALEAAEDVKDDGYVAMSRYVSDWEVAP